MPSLQHRTDAPDRRRRSYRGVSPEERDDLRRERLRAAGLELFGTIGWNGTSVAALCRSAGVTTRNFYELYANREELFLDVYDRLNEDALERVGAALAGAPAEDIDALLETGVRAAVEAWTADPRAGRIVFLEVMGISPAIQARRVQVMTGSAQMIEAWMPQPRPRQRLTAIALVGAIAELMMHLTVGDDPPPRDDAVAEIVRLCRLALAPD